ncbi:MAG: hypothetical protein O7G31_01560, partial [Calditrichaeota bacterium]|nr:hypothetical protein [Calditrichota bacterium]
LPQFSYWTFLQHIDPIKKQENIEMLQESPIRKLGKTSLSDLRNGSTKSSTMLKRQSFASTQDMSGGLRTAYGGANQFVQVDGVIDSRTYGVLRPHGLVAVKGANESFSGLYYVTQVRHEFTIDEYTQYFKAYRNGIGLTGDEDFNVAQAPFAIMPGVSNTSIGSGNLVLPAQQEGAVIPGGF